MGGVINNLITNYKDRIENIITNKLVLSVILLFSILRYFDYLDTIKDKIRIMFISKFKMYYDMKTSVYYGDDQILYHQKDNMKGIKAVYYYIFNIINPEKSNYSSLIKYFVKSTNTKSSFTINKIPNEIKFKWTYTDKNGESVNTEFFCVYCEIKTERKTEINLRIYGKSRDDIDKLITESVKQYKEHLKTSSDKDHQNYIYVPKLNCRYLTYNQYKCVNNSSFDQLFINEKKEFLKHIEKFKQGKSLHKFLSLLLSGKPGTGKTSIIRMMAKYFNRSVVYIKLSQVKSLEQLLEIIHSDSYDMEDSYGSVVETINIGKNKIIVFEDIDVCGNIVSKRHMETDKVKKEEKQNIDILTSNLMLDDILNVLNGVIPINDLIIVMTTNHKDKLDNALIRPGRITYDLELNEINLSCMCRMIHYYYSKEKMLNQIAIDLKNIKADNIIPCILENIIKNTDSYEELISILANKEKLNQYYVKYVN